MPVLLLGDAAIKDLTARQSGGGVGAAAAGQRRRAGGAAGRTGSGL